MREPARLWDPVPAETLSDRITGRIRAALFAREIKPGDYLGSEAALAERFGVSRMAARDALRSLEALGIVEIRVGAKGGAWVASGNPQRFADALAIQLELIGVSIEEIFDAQIAIEVMAVDLAARRATAEDHARLEALLAELSAKHDDPAAFTDLAMRFHEGVVEASHNRALTAQFKGLRFLLEPLYARKAASADIPARAIAAHRAVLDAIERGDHEEARRLVYARLVHIRDGQVADPIPPRD
ncbi:MAG TPA: FCD domain-containing protein [Candidatus Limnocylindria bacterium]|nr:FCD domain-containing protein [Candidatus Limnocylindria bacterium]